MIGPVVGDGGGMGGGLASPGFSGMSMAAGDFLTGCALARAFGRGPLTNVVAFLQFDRRHLELSRELTDRTDRGTLICLFSAGTLEIQRQLIGGLGTVSATNSGGLLRATDRPSSPSAISALAWVI